MHNPASELRRISIPRTPVHKGIRKGRAFTPGPYEAFSEETYRGLRSSQRRNTSRPLS
jgi:hypothetical protein